VRARHGFSERPCWPLIVLRSPKGWTCPAQIDGKQCENSWRSHQVPMGDTGRPEHIRILEAWMKSYRPEELFDENGRLRPELAELAPKGHRRMGDNPHANGGLLLRSLSLPDFRDYALDMVVLNDLDRFHLVEDVIDRLPHLGASAAYVKQAMRDKRCEHQHYIREHGEDLPEVRNWQWPG
jgi:phosphoketolase